MHAQLCTTLCNAMDCSPLGSSVHRILQARIPEWVATSYSRRFPDPRIEPESPGSPALAGRIFTTLLLGLMIKIGADFEGCDLLYSKVRILFLII